MATTTTMTATTARHHHRFPRMLGRFLNLEGGLYGSLHLVALTRETLELQTGEDFVRFDRAQAKNLRDTIDKFLALEEPIHHEGGGEVEEVVVQEERVDELVTRRPSREKRPKNV
jgi:hypothetical protein